MTIVKFDIFCIHKKQECKKRLTIFPSPAGMSPTKLSLDGNNKINPVQEDLVSDILAEDGKMANLFLQ
jgi:hypothetical protein